ncbi:ATPAP18/PAP18 [Arabidopsis lyrata subsp. lyrata]|uniref:Purple acid phosphatase n=1 Tax=Arabidopsis lyrata subsp. lyrata TaxID=81972 RepID=D7LB06_ARALL|nr:ATPAP18/PAP18 [Arabidopsis lyrata subsp. lyrata]
MEKWGRLLLVTVSALIFASVAADDYVRPKPRETLQFPWKQKSSSLPEQVHISLAGDKHMRVTWVTSDKSSPSFVEYGTSPGKYSYLGQGESTSYSYIMYRSGKIHHTVIGPLEADTVYYYRCSGEGPEFHLKTPPAQFPITFAVAGDLGQTGWTKSTLDHIDQCIYAVHLLPGDLSYADYMQHKWDTFGELVQPLASVRPWMADLAKVDRERTPWLIVLFHVPWYNSNNAHQHEGDEMMAEMEPLLYASGVDIVFTGHVHAYERTKRVNNGKSDPCGPVHITIGDGGNREGLARKYKDPSPEWSVFREASFGHGELQMVNSTHALWTWHRNDDDEPTRSDEVWLNSLVNSGCLKKRPQELRKMLLEP